MEKHLGRKIPKGMEVHHRNGRKLDNRIENLQLLSKSAHATLHRAYRDRKRRGQKKYVIRTCPVCGGDFARLRSQIKRNSNTGTCSRICAGKARSKK